MVILYKDPKGDNIFQRSMSQTGTIIGNKIQEDDGGRYLDLEQHCKQLEGRLAKCGEVRSLPYTHITHPHTTHAVKAASFPSRYFL